MKLKLLQVLLVLAVTPVAGTATPKPESVSIVDVPSERRDSVSNIGNIKVRFSDGHSEVWTSDGRCMYALVSPTGLVGWTLYISRNDYGRPVNSILRVRFLSGQIKDFEAPPYIEKWGFADNDSAVIIKARGGLPNARPTMSRTASTPVNCLRVSTSAHPTINFLNGHSLMPTERMA